MNTISLRILMDAFFIGILIWCSYSDIKKRFISNYTIMLLLCLAIANMIFTIISGSTWWQYPLALLLTIPFFISWTKNGMGAGDVKLIISIALYSGLFNMLVSFAVMVPVLLFLVARSWRINKTIKCRIPFAPVLAIGAICAVFLSYLYALLSI